MDLVRVDVLFQQDEQVTLNHDHFKQNKPGGAMPGHLLFFTQSVSDSNKYKCLH